MDMQTDAMIKMAKDDRYVTAGQHKETKEWHGMLMVNHPTPSGCDRYLLALSDNRGWEDAETAKLKMEEALKDSEI